MKIETNQSVVAYHVVTGATPFNYPIDAQHAVSAHPDEWSMTPWSADDAAAARERLEQKGVDMPPPDELSPEDQEALDQHTKAVAEANERLAAYRAKKEQERLEAEQVARDEAIANSAPPRPDPEARRRPFGRKGEPTPAEKALAEKQAAKKAKEDRMAKEKADLDKGAGVQLSS